MHTVLSALGKAFQPSINLKRRELATGVLALEKPRCIGRLLRALLGFEVAQGLVLWVVLLRIGGPYYPLAALLGLASGCALGFVLLRQGA